MSNEFIDLNSDETEIVAILLKRLNENLKFIFSVHPQMMIMSPMSLCLCKIH